jgi:predicted ATP-binding protein involved in virulence
MKIQKIEIDGVGGIEHLTLNFNEGMNLICGPNGIGKTTILECLAHSFSQIWNSILHKNVKSEYSSWKISVQHENGISENTYSLTKYHPNEGSEYINGDTDFTKKVIVFKTHRTFDYIQINSVNRDPKKDQSDISQDISTGTNPNDIKSWFMSRYVWSAHESGLKPEQINNFEKAKKCFNVLDQNVKFAKVIPDNLDIVVGTQQGEVYFEYLSSGYKSCLFILLGLIKEVEFRLKEPYINIQDFDGVILIDELDLHLHPQWQATLIKSLKALVPKAQIIATTHSPNMIQAAEPNEIIPLGFNNENKVYVRDMSLGQFGYKGWTIEEILIDVMGLEDVRSDEYLTTMRNFDIALDNDDYNAAKEAYNILTKMLHPKNHLVKLLKIQMAGMEV